MRLPLPLLIEIAPLLATAMPSIAAAATSPQVAGTVFLHVNVVPMDRERILYDQTVVVSDGRIKAVGRALAAPEGFEIIDGQGRAFLSPGLADMHTHSETRNDMAMFLSYGVTTVVQMGGARAAFVDTTVPLVNRGELPGPHVYSAFLVDGTPEYNGFIIKTPAQARSIVEMAKFNGYDFMKVYVGLAPDVFHALADEGRREGMPLVGHGVTSVRVANQLADGQVMVAHAEEFF